MAVIITLVCVTLTSYLIMVIKTKKRSHLYYIRVGIMPDVLAGPIVMELGEEAIYAQTLE